MNLTHNKPVEIQDKESGKKMPLLCPECYTASIKTQLLWGEQENNQFNQYCRRCGWASGLFDGATAEDLPADELQATDDKCMYCRYPLDDDEYEVCRECLTELEAKQRYEDYINQ